MLWGGSLVLAALFCGASALRANSRCRQGLQAARLSSTTLSMSPREGGSPLKTLGLLGATAALALGANFLGITSALLSTSPGSEESILSDLYEINGFRRITSEALDYAFLVPSSWSPDLMVLQTKMKFKELPLELQQKSELQGMPDSAYTAGEGKARINNISVVKSVVLPGFSLRQTLGPPKDALAYLAGKSLAPPGSGKQIDIVGAYQDEDPKGNERYQFEYVVRKASWETGRHTLSAIMFRPSDNQLLTATVVVPENEWAARSEQAEKMIKSFELLSH